MVLIVLVIVITFLSVIVLIILIVSFLIIVVLVILVVLVVVLILVLVVTIVILAVVVLLLIAFLAVIVVILGVSFQGCFLDLVGSSICLTSCSSGGNWFRLSICLLLFLNCCSLHIFVGWLDDFAWLGTLAL